MRQLKLTPIIDKMSEWDKRWTSVLNEVDVYDAYRQSGKFPKSIVDQVGQEALSEIMSGFVKHITDFFRWLRDKILAAIARVREFFRAVGNWIKLRLGGMFSRQKSPILRLPKGKSFEIQYDYSAIQSKLSTAIQWYCGAPVMVNPYSAGSVQEGRTHYSDIKNQLDEVLSTKKPTTTTIGMMCAGLDRIYNTAIIIPWEYTGIEKVYNKVASVTMSFEQTVTDDQTVLDNMKQVCLALYKELAPLIDLRTNYTHHDMQLPPDASNHDHLEALKRASNFAMMILSFGIDVYAKVCKWMRRQYKMFAADQNAVNLEVKLPDDMRQHLESMYGLPFTARTIYISSLSPKTWNQFSNPAGGFVAGFTRPTFVDPRSPDCIWVNASILVGKHSRSKRFAMFMDPGAFGKVRSRERALLSVIVHEYRHNADLQSGMKFNMKVPYNERDHEIRAKKMEKIYTPTQSELEWASHVIAQVTAQYETENSDDLESAEATV